MRRTDSPPQPPIAVVGVGAIMPGSIDAAGFWNSIVRGEDLITEVPRSHWLVEDYYDPDPAAIDKTYVRRGSFLPTIDFDPAEFGIPPSTVPATDTAQLFALQVADQTLRDALGDEYDTADRGGIGCILGSGNLELLSEIDLRLGRPMWLKALRELGYSDADARRTCDHVLKDYPQWQEATLPGGLGNIVAGRVANRLNLHAVNYTVDAACASSLAAVSAGVNELVLGRADMIISGGVDALNNPCTFVSFCKTPALSPTEDCRPFSAQADGTLLGEGVAMVALKRLDDARRDGNKIYAVIRGIGSSSDGRGAAIYAPAPGGQVRAVRAAYADAGYGPETVGLVEAHGTGTVVGDRTEVTALTEVFGDAERTGDRWCALGSVKSQIGHTKSAAGAAGLLKAVLALHHHTLPPTIKVTEPNADLSLDSSPFYLNTVCRPWVRPADHPRRASVSSFGFGGINFHIALEEAPAPAGGSRAAGESGESGDGLVRRHRLPRAAGSELVLFGADTPEQIVAALRAIDTSRPTAGIARASRREFDSRRPVRLALVAGSAEQLGTRIDQAANLIGQRPREPFTNPRGLHYAVPNYAAPTDAAPTDAAGTGIPPVPPPAAAPPAFLFPGQGSQYVGMGTDVALRYPAAQEVWDRLGGLRFGGTPLHEVVFPPPTFDEAERAARQSTLTAAEWAQPAIALHSLALLAVLDGYGVRPPCVAGHSFGELTALCAAGVLDAESLVILARRRGELLRNTTERAGGRMLAAVAAHDDVAAALDGLPDRDVWVANHNAPRQLVLSGTAAALETVQGKLAAEGIATRWLETATAFHCPPGRGGPRPAARGARGHRDPSGALRGHRGLRRPALPVRPGADPGADRRPAHRAGAVRRPDRDHVRRRRADLRRGGPRRGPHRPGQPDPRRPGAPRDQPGPPRPGRRRHAAVRARPARRPGRAADLRRPAARPRRRAAPEAGDDDADRRIQLRPQLPAAAGRAIAQRRSPSPVRRDRLPGVRASRARLPGVRRRSGRAGRAGPGPSRRRRRPAAFRRPRRTAGPGSGSGRQRDPDSTDGTDRRTADAARRTIAGRGIPGGTAGGRAAGRRSDTDTDTDTDTDIDIDTGTAARRADARRADAGCAGRGAHAGSPGRGADAQGAVPRRAGHHCGDAGGGVVARCGAGGRCRRRAGLVGRLRRGTPADRPGPGRLPAPDDRGTGGVPAHDGGHVRTAGRCTRHGRAPGARIPAGRADGEPRGAASVGPACATCGGGAGHGDAGGGDACVGHAPGAGGADEHHAPAGRTGPGRSGHGGAARGAGGRLDDRATHLRRGRRAAGGGAGHRLARCRSTWHCR
ncbi:type I polyketide synthase [Frankia sp. ArI3]|uniref:type I polyketide synthase n=1 Tax=Frankia sp. ArI3 TaxID=1858 RepID=UPI002106F178|nr:type I polyketide synthase [Frankia sp. ArI3]